MPDYKYEAIANDGSRTNGTISASTEREAAGMLDARGLFPLKVTLITASAGGINFGVPARKVSAFYAQLADLLQAGVPLLKSLDILEKQSSNKLLSFAVREVRARVADGTTLADSMRQFPKIFNELAVSMIRAGQEGGFLEDVLRRIADFTEKQEDLKSKVVGSMAYPVILAFVGSGIVMALLIFLVPKFEPIFGKLKAKGNLPVMTQYLLGASKFLENNWWWTLPIPFLMMGAFLLWRRTPSARLFIDRMSLKIPVAGGLILSIALARFTRILGTLLANGIPILRSLEIAKDSTGNKVLAKAIEESAENITSGQKLAAPLRKSGYFPNDIVEMISVGEESNTLEKVLIDVANNLEKRSTRQLELFVRLLEPFMLLLMAVVVLFVVIALLLPVFKMGSAVG